MLRKAIVAMSKVLIKVLPKNHFGDMIFLTLRFTVKQRRFPSKRMMFNDVLFRLQTSRALGDPQRVFVTDKEYVKIFVKAIVGDEFNVPTLAVLHSDGDIDNFDFPEHCCVKATHSSAMTLFCRGDKQIDREILKSWLRSNYYNKSREINYKTLKPKIIVEPLIFNTDNPEDYKFFCYNGKVRLIHVHKDRHGDHSSLLFDRNWTEQNYALSSQKSKQVFPRPNNLSQMIKVAEALSAYFDFVRVDLYSDGETCKVGEITHLHNAAIGRFDPPSAEVDASKLIFGSR